MIFKSPIEICASAAVSPKGVGVDALLSSREPNKAMISLLSSSSRKISVLQVDPQDSELACWKQESRLRRASPISIFMADCVKQILKRHPIAPKELGIIAAFSTGALT